MSLNRGAAIRISSVISSGAGGRSCRRVNGLITVAHSCTRVAVDRDDADLGDAVFARVDARRLHIDEGKRREVHRGSIGGARRAAIIERSFDAVQPKPAPSGPPLGRSDERFRNREVAAADSRLVTRAAGRYVRRDDARHAVPPRRRRLVSKTFAAPTKAQSQAWPAIQAGRHVLVAAPTGSGKTLAAFLAAIDDLVRQGVAGALPDETPVVYVSPLKALSNDIQRNLDGAARRHPRASSTALGLPDVEIRTLVRTGDTPQSERASMRRRPPHIVVTTPESLYVLLGSESGRKMLATTRTVIVDEIHALAGNKRGSHLALSLERLAALTRNAAGAHRACRRRRSRSRRSRASWSATAGQPRRSAAMRDRRRRATCATRDLALEVPPSPLEAVMSDEVWEQVYARLAELAREHRTTLVFVNTRRMAERVARHLSELLGDEHVTAHHGSMAKELRLDAEQRLKSGELQGAGRHRFARARHRHRRRRARLPARLAALDRDVPAARGTREPLRSAACRRRGSFRCRATSWSSARRCSTRCGAASSTALSIPPKPLDVLAQQIVAEVAAAEWTRGRAVRRSFRRAYPYATLTRDEFLAVVRMLAEGFSTRRGHRAAYVHRDAVNGVLRGRRGARLTALTSGGAIPDNADYDVVLEPAGQLVGTVNEDFAIESLAGDIFQLGNTSYRILRVEAGRVRVEDAHGQPPTIPFWLGEAPGAHRRAVARGVAAARRRRRAARRQRDRQRASSIVARHAARRSGRGAARRLSRRRARRARHAADAEDDRVRALLRRIGRHAARHPLAVRQPHQPRVGTRAAQALLPQVQFRAAGGGDRRRDRAVAVDEPQLPARRRWRATCTRRRVRDAADPGDARRADVRRALALDRRRSSLALPRFRGGKKVPRAAAAHARRGSAGGGVSRPDRLRREPRRRRARSPTIRWSTRRSTTACTRRWTSRAWNGCCARIESGDDRDRSRAT